MGDSRLRQHCVTSMGLHWRYSGFPHDQNNCDLSGLNVTCIYWGLCEDKHVKLTALETCLHAKTIGTFFFCVWSARIDQPNSCDHALPVLNYDRTDHKTNGALVHSNSSMIQLRNHFEGESEFYDDAITLHSINPLHV